MTPGEKIAGLSLIGGALAWVLMQLRGFIESREKKLDAVVENVGDIRRALLGDDFGHQGLVAEFASVKASQARTERRVDEIEHRLEAMEQR
jgi:hypothetical protein